MSSLQPERVLKGSEEWGGGFDKSAIMLELFGHFTHFLKIQDSVTIDNNVFRLHYKVSFGTPQVWLIFTFQASVMVLSMATLLVTARQYIGDPIDCMVEVTTQWWYVGNAFIVELTKRNDETLKLPSTFISQALSPSQGIPNGIMDTYCWIHSTFSIPGRSKHLISSRSTSSPLISFV